MCDLNLDSLWDELDLGPPPVDELLTDLLAEPECPLPGPVAELVIPIVERRPEPVAVPVPPATVSPVPSRTCPVPTCRGAMFSRPVALRRHWMVYHMPTIKMPLCPVRGCTFRSPREDKVRAHAGQVHQKAFS